MYICYVFFMNLEFSKFFLEVGSFLHQPLFFMILILRADGRMGLFG